MTESDQETFEYEAVRRADRTKRQGYYRAMGTDQQLFEQYRQIILRDHFEQMGA